jgi:aryl-alcohol dehydrogenase-like predicted oxidoreductase
MELGVNFFDTAEMYSDGESERILGRALKGRRGEAVIASKIHTTPMTRENVKKACEASLKRLETDYIDLYQIHFIDRRVPIEDTLGAFEELRQDGKIRAAGTCNSGIHDIAALCRHGQVVTNQMPYSLIWRAIEFGIREACMDNGVDLLCYSPLALGLLTGKFRSAEEVPAGRARTRHFSRDRAHTRHSEPGFERETFETIGEIRRICAEAGISMAVASVAWVLAKEGVASVIVGARNPDQISENVSAMDVEVPDEVMHKLSAATRELRALLGPNPDLWQSDSRAG